MVGPKKQDFWPKINILKGNHCVLRIWEAPVCQNLDMILENKVVQKLKLEKIVFLQKLKFKTFSRFEILKQYFWQSIKYFKCFSPNRFIPECGIRTPGKND